MIRKHFQVAKQQDLHNTQESDYHPFQFVKSDMDNLGDKS